MKIFLVLMTLIMFSSCSSYVLVKNCKKVENDKEYFMCEKDGDF